MTIMNKRPDDELGQHVGTALREELMTSEPGAGPYLLAGTLAEARRLRRNRAVSALALTLVLLVGLGGGGWAIATHRSAEGPPVAGLPSGTILIDASTPEGASTFVQYVDADGVYHRSDGTRTSIQSKGTAALPDGTNRFLETEAGVVAYSIDDQGTVWVSVGAGDPFVAQVDPANHPVAFRGGVVWQGADGRALVVAADGSRRYRSVPLGWVVVGATQDHLWARNDAGTAVATVTLDGRATPVSGYSGVEFTDLVSDAVVLSTGECSVVLSGTVLTPIGPEVCGRVIAVELINDRLRAAVLPNNQPGLVEVVNLVDGSVEQTVSVANGTGSSAPTDAVFDYDGYLVLRVEARLGGDAVVALVTVDETGNAWRSTGWSGALTAPDHLVTTNVE